MNTESLTRDILQRKAIGAAGMGGPFSAVPDRYGEPTDTCDHQGIGLSEECKIWLYDELQVWSNDTGVVDHIFYHLPVDRRSCSNANFLSDIENYREQLNWTAPLWWRYLS